MVNQTGTSSRNVHVITVRRKKLNNMKSEKILSIGAWGKRVTGAEGQLASLTLFNVGTYAMAYTGVVANSATDFSLNWQTPYVKNVVGVLPPDDAGGTGALPVADNTKAKQKVGLSYCEYDIEFSNNTNANTHIELYFYVCKKNSNQDVPNCIINTASSYGLGAPVNTNAAAGLAAPHTTGYTTHTTLGTKVGDWPQVRQSFKLIKKVMFMLPPTSNAQHLFKINYNKMFDEVADMNQQDFMAGKSLTCYFRARGELIKDSTDSHATISISPVDVSVQITARKYFQAANDPLQPPLKFASIALPTGATLTNQQIMSAGENVATMVSAFT